MWIDCVWSDAQISSVCLYLSFTLYIHVSMSLSSVLLLLYVSFTTLSSFHLSPPLSLSLFIVIHDEKWDPYLCYFIIGNSQLYLHSSVETHRCIQYFTLYLFLFWVAILLIQLISKFQLISKCSIFWHDDYLVTA